MNKLRLALLPLSVIYSGVMSIRNWYYEKLYNRYRVPVKSIVVGNLSAGGTGKTPFTEFLLNHIKEDHTAVLSRGYGRKTTGYIAVSSHHSAEEVGDEPLQMAKKFTNTSFHVAENRAIGIQNLLSNEPKTKTIILDDAFQHLRIKAGFYILISTYQNPFYKDFVLPGGNLRENRTGAKRANAIIINKCPQTISEERKEEIIRKTRKYTSAPVYFAHLNYHSANISNNENYILVTGIANPKPLIEHLDNSSFEIKEHLAFKDHHNFTENDFRRIIKAQKKNKAKIITTEKDAVRLSTNDQVLTHLIPIPIEIQLSHTEKNQFLSQIRNFSI